MTVKEIDKRLEELKLMRQNVTGTTTEVYSRIVGYYRSLNNWNKGKREEYDYRQYYNSTYANVGDAHDKSAPMQGELTLDDSSSSVSEATSYLFFYRQTCPNCPPMKEALSSYGMEGNWIDVDTETGYAMAEQYTIMAAPTVIFVDQDGRELHRASQPKDLPVRETLSV